MPGNVRWLAFAVLILCAPPGAAQPAAGDVISVAIGPDNTPRAIKPGGGRADAQAFRDCPTCPEMVVVPAGSFMMGAPEAAHRAAWMGPQHKVDIPAPFAIGRFEVTFAEWDACVTDGGCGGLRLPDAWGRGDQPVTETNWYDAQGYVTWLSKKTAKKYRLPSEAEWEYAARAGTTTQYWFGDTISYKDANLWDLKNDVYLKKTVPVKSYRPNPWGLYQVHGNVDEWVDDCFTKDFDTTPRDGTAWKPEACPLDTGIIRGGCWTCFAENIAVFDRGQLNRSKRSRILGFRVVRDLP